MKVCPECNTPLERRPDAHYWRGVFMHGWFCKPCNSLWDIGFAFIKYVNKKARQRANELLASDRRRKTMFDAVELLEDYTKAAREAILDVADGSIGAGENPLAFVICAFRSQAAKIKELTGNGSQDQSTRYQSRELGSSSLRQPTDVTYGPTEKDGGRFIYWGGKCRGKLMPQYDYSKGE